MFLRKKIEPVLGIDAVKYATLPIRSGKYLNGSKVKHSGQNNPKIAKYKESEMKKKKN